MGCTDQAAYSHDQCCADQRDRTSNTLVNFGNLFAAGLGPFAQTGSFAVRQVARQAPVRLPILLHAHACFHRQLEAQLQRIMWPEHRGNSILAEPGLKKFCSLIVLELSWIAILNRWQDEPARNTPGCC